MTSRSEAQDVLRRLRSEAPELGAPDPCHRPPSRVLEWLVGEVPLGGTSLETGCGWSTIVLGLVTDRHVAIGPDPAEHDRIRAWCATHDVALDGVELVAARAEHHLPSATAAGTLAPATFDLVRVDGDHAAPLPALDAFHATPLLRTGGLMVFERARIGAVAEVVGRLRADTDGWIVRHEVDDTVVLQRRAAGPATPAHWSEQPGNDELHSLEGRARALRQRLRRSA